MLGILYHKTIKGCGSIKSPEDLHFFQNNCLEVMSFEDMLNTKFRTDAHFVTYSIPGFPLWPRLKKGIIEEIRSEGYDIVLSYFAFDWDNTDHKEWTQETLQAFGNKIASCTDAILSKWCAIYTTKHGARIIYKLSFPVPADIGEHHLVWMIHKFKEQGFTQIDESCKDWTRCFRAPLVMRDNIATWEQPYYSIITKEDILNISLVGKTSPDTIAKKTYFQREKQEMPSYASLETLLKTINKSTGKTIQTEFYKRAKKALKNTQYLDVLFNDAAPGWIEGVRNNEILKLLGVITPLLLRQAHASVNQIFALVIHPLLTLDGEDWIKHGWNALLDIYEREINKYNYDNEVQATKATKEIEILNNMVEGMKEWNSHPSLMQDQEEAREFVRHNLLATSSNFFFLMCENGYYESFPVVANQVISRIRKTFRNILIPTTKISTTGEEIDMSVTQIQNEFSTPVQEILMKPVGNKGGYIQDINGEKPALVLSTFARNDDLEPTYNEYVDEWLKNLFGDAYEKGNAWIGNALAFEEGLICALSLEGASNAGKKLLTQGLAECLKKPYLAGPLDIYGSSSAFLNTPFLVVNEAWPEQRGMVSPADSFKMLTGGDGIRVNEKYKPVVTVLCPVRIILTANDDGIIRTLTHGKDMTLDNRIAIGERLFHTKVSPKAMQYLKNIGGMGFTAKQGQRWIRPDSGNEESDFVVAKHFLWLYKNRDRVDASQRFLVMGNSAPGAAGKEMTVFEKLLADNNSTPLVAQAVIEMLDKPKGLWSKYMRTNQEMTRIWVTRYGIHKYIKEVLEERVQERDIFSGMLNLLVGTEPVEMEGVHWYEISVDALVQIATERGINQTYIRTMYVNKLAIKAKEAKVQDGKK